MYYSHSALNNNLGCLLKSDRPYGIKRIWAGMNNCVVAGLSDYINDIVNYHGPVVWEREPEVKELALQEVADKFGIPVEQLRIKDGTTN